MFMRECFPPALHGRPGHGSLSRAHFSFGSEVCDSSYSQSARFVRSGWHGRELSLHSNFWELGLRQLVQVCLHLQSRVESVRDGGPKKFISICTWQSVFLIRAGHCSARCCFLALRSAAKRFLRKSFIRINAACSVSVAGKRMGARGFQNHASVSKPFK